MAQSGSLLIYLRGGERTGLEPREKSALVRNIIQERSGRMKFMLHARCTLWQEELETFRKMHSMSQLFSFRKLEI